jgi:hypothetical protein
MGTIVLIGARGKPLASEDISQVPQLPSLNLPQDCKTGLINTQMPIKQKGIKNKIVPKKSTNARFFSLKLA